MAVVLSTVFVLLTILEGSKSAAVSGSCPTEVVNITAALKPGWKYEIQTPGFPNQYPANATCTWRVILPDYLSSSYNIMLMFDTYEIEPCSDCGCDYLTSGKNEKELLQISYHRRCKLYSKNYIAFQRLTDIGISVSSGDGEKELWLRFHSDHSSEFKGLKGKLRVIHSGYRCNSYLNDTSGSIASPKYPSQYPKSQSIIWCLTVPHGFRVKLKFTAFELENTTNKDNYDCRNDYVEVRDGMFRFRRSYGYGELLGRFCGDTIPDEIYSSSNHMWVKFVSDNNASTVYKGFKADFVNDGNLVTPSTGFSGGNLVTSSTGISGGNLVTSSILAWILATVLWLLVEPIR